MSHNLLDYEDKDFGRISWLSTRTVAPAGAESLLSASCTLIGSIIAAIDMPTRVSHDDYRTLLEKWEIQEDRVTAAITQLILTARDSMLANRGLLAIESSMRADQAARQDLLVQIADLDLQNTHPIEDIAYLPTADLLSILRTLRVTPLQQ